MIRTNGEDHVNHMFSDGVPEQGKQATVIDAEWLNAVQEEIAQFIELAGITLDGSNPHQLRDALLAIFMAGIEVGGTGINISGTGGETTVTNGGIRFQGSGLDVSLTAQGLTINGVNVKEITVQGVATLNINETLELVKNLIVNGSATFKGNARVNGNLVVDGNLSLENDLHSNVQGNVVGSTTGTHYGNVHSDQILPMTNGQAISQSKTLFTEIIASKATFSSPTVEHCWEVAGTGSGGLDNLIMDTVYTSLGNGAKVNVVNTSGSLALIATGRDDGKYVKIPGYTGCVFIKLGSKWYPMYDVELSL